MKKCIKIVLINILIIISLLVALEFFVWAYENHQMKKTNEDYIGIWPLPFHSGEKYFDIDLNYFPSPKDNWGREVEGLKNKKPPIAIFGCSVAYGYLLDKEQTVSYKIAEQAKRPVYNRAVTGWGVQHMYYQAINPILYEQVPEPEYVIFIMIKDHFRRLYTKCLSSGHLLYEERYLRYKDVNGKLVEIREPKVKNPIDFIRYIKNRSYIFNKLRTIYVYDFILREGNYNKYFDFTLKHFIDSKKEMQKHWKDSKYVVLLYDDFYNYEIFGELLEKNGFMVISLPELTGIDFNTVEYQLPKDSHPNEAAWDVIVPALIKELKL